MKWFILKVAILALKIIYIPFQCLGVQNKITYISRQSDTIPQDYQLLVEEVSRRNKDIKNVILTRKISGGKHSVVTYPFHMLGQMFHIATSKFVIVDGYCIVASLLPHKKETKLIQIWHASAALKKFGYQTLDKPSGSSSKMAEVMRMHRNYDYVFALSNITAEHYCEAFNVPKDIIRLIGMPHYSVIKDFNNDSAMNNAYPALKNKPNILFMPTFRKGKDVEIKPLIDNFDFDKYNLIARLHPLETAPKDDPRVIYDDKFSTYDWINKADIIIADYSSLIVECAWLRKKMFFYLYDYEEYCQDPGVNVDYEKEGLLELSFRDASHLNNTLDNEYKWNVLDRFAQKYVEVDAQNSVHEFVDFMFRQF